MKGNEGVQIFSNLSVYFLKSNKVATMSIDTIEVSKHVDLLACARIAHVLMIGATSAPVAVIQCDIIFLASFLPHCLGHSWEQIVQRF